MKYLFTESQVYCGTYHKYNSGSLFGEWVNLYDYNDEDELMVHLKELHSDEDDPEFMFQDTDNFPIFICSGEPSWGDVIRCLEFCNYLWDDKYDEHIIEAASKVEDFSKMSPSEVESWLDEHYVGELDKNQMAEQCLNDNGVPHWIWHYIDLDELGDSLIEDYDEYDGYYFN